MEVSELRVEDSRFWIHGLELGLWFFMGQG